MPRTYFEDLELGAWCAEIRLCTAEAIKWVPGRSRRGLLSNAQQRALEEADFPFNRPEVVLWEVCLLPIASVLLYIADVEQYHCQTSSHPLSMFAVLCDACLVIGALLWPTCLKKSSAAH